MQQNINFAVCGGSRRHRGSHQYSFQERCRGSTDQRASAFQKLGLFNQEIPSYRDLPIFPTLTRASAAYLDVPNVHATPTSPYGYPGGIAASGGSDLQRTILALTLIDNAAPTIGVAWVDYADPDFVASETTQGWWPNFSEGQASLTPTSINQSAKGWIDKYLNSLAL